MLLFSLSEYLRDLACPSPIVPALTDIDNPQKKLAGYLESRIFPGHASALEIPSRSINAAGIKFVPRFVSRMRAVEVSSTIHRELMTLPLGG